MEAVELIKILITLATGAGVMLGLERSGISVDDPRRRTKAYVILGLSCAALIAGFSVIEHIFEPGS